MFCSGETDSVSQEPGNPLYKNQVSFLQELRTIGTLNEGHKHKFMSSHKIYMY